MASPQEGRGSSGSATTQTITSVDPTWTSPQVNSTGHGTEVLLEPSPGVIGLATDGTETRITTSAGVFRFLANGLQFPRGQQLTGEELGDGCTSLITVDSEEAGSPAAGTLLYYNGTQWLYLPAGTNGQGLVLQGGEPVWAGVASLDATGHVQQYAVADTTEASTNDTLGSTSSLLNNLNRIRYQLAQLGTGAWNTLRAMVQLSPASQQTGSVNVSGEVQGSDFKPGGLSGATAATRFVGGTVSGAPTTGTFAVGDYVVTQNGSIFICTVAGTPGTWVQVSGGGGTGTVTSVGLATSGVLYSVAGSPVTSSGTMNLNLNTQSANTILAGPTTGVAATPTMRPLVSADLPSAPTVSGEVTASDFKPTGLTGATAASRYVGGTASGAPTTGTFAVGDFVVDQTGKAWVCTVAGTPGTWAQLAGGGTSTLAADTDVAIASPVGGQVLGYSSALSKWVNQNQAGVAATTQTAQLGADVTMTTVNTFYDAASVSLPPGTWLLVAGACCESATTSGFTAKLWDGTTVFASDEQVNPFVNYPASIALAAVVSPSSTTTYRLSCASNSAGDTIKAATPNNASGNTATYLRAIQLSGNPVGQQAPAVRCTNSVAISIPNATSTALTFDTNRYDQGTSTPQHSTSANTGRLICQQAGIYHIWGCVQYSGPGGGAGIWFRLNGTTDIGDSFYSASGATDIVNASTTYQLNVGDYVELMCYQNSGGALNANKLGNTSPDFGMARIDSGPGAVQPNTKVQLDYAASTDLMSNTAISATTWTDLSANQTFTVDDANSVVEIAVSGNCFIGANATNIQRESSSRIVIDSAGTTINKMLGGAICPPVSGQTSYANCLSGANVIEITGLSAGSHTVKVQVYADGASVGYCRASSLPNSEFLAIRVLERKQSVSPPSSTPAPAVRAVQSGTAQSIANATWTALTLDTTTFDQGVSAPQHSTSSNTSRLTCQQAGVYVITGVAGFNSSAAGARRLLRIRVNGTTEIGRSEEPSGGSYFPDLTVCGTYSLAVGDYIELYAYQDTGTTLSVTSPILSMARIDSGGQGFVPIPMVKTANYTATATDGMLVAGASGLTFTLPASSSYGGKAPFVVKNDSFTGTIIAAAGTDTIDGAATYSLFAAQASVSLVADPASGKWRSI